MEQKDNNLKKDFTVVFKEIEKFHSENPSYNDNGVAEEDLKNDETIREFAEICRQINDSETNSTVYLTFS
ncbi:MAG: hypothetical protein A2V64_09020 [Bacteroidetes bacterium RBG_13_43_22]|nr:MAG: hypothetical protein A2V64_09020 [Bacteroidetes bacterium RBG_13_43_22]